MTIQSPSGFSGFPFLVLYLRLDQPNRRAVGRKVLGVSEPGSGLDSDFGSLASVLVLVCV